MTRTIHEAARALRAGTLTPTDLVEECLSAIDRHEGRVRAWVSVDRDGALAEAERLLSELRAGFDRGPLHGIPVGVKDIFDVAGWPTAAGSRLWKDAIARADSDAIHRLRQSGAILLGKTVTTSYASFDPPVTRNPWDTSRTPGGSSSGSAAAVACGMCLAALASQTGGSISRPASYCGVAGLKPTHGRVGLGGVVPLAPTMDHAGVIAGCVRDLALVFEAIALPAGTGHGSVRPQPEEIVWLGGMFERLADGAVRALAGALRERHRFAPVTPPAEFADILRHHRVIMAVEAAAFHGERFRRHPEDYPPRITGLIEEGLACPAVAYHDARNARRAARAAVSALTRSHVLMTPATTTLPPPADTTGDPAFNSPWSFTGHPTVSLPAGWSEDGLPFCVQLIGAVGRETDLFALAARCEERFARVERPVPA